MADDEILDKQADESQTDEHDDETDKQADDEEKKSLEDKLKEVVDVRVEEVGSLRKKLTITVPHDTIGEQLDDQYGELRRDAMVPGFRKGRAPRRLLERRFGHEVSETLVQQMVGTGYMAAIDKSDLKIIGDPMIWAKEKDADSETLMEFQKAMELIELPADEPLVFSCEVEVQPEFELPEVEGIPIKKPDVKVTEENITEQVDRIRAARGTYDTLPEGTVQMDDVVITDVKMSSGDAVLKEQEAVRVPVRPQIVDGVSLEKLGEAFAGAKVGDVRTASGTIADDYVKLEHRGKQADFEFKIREIQRMNMPEMGEEFLKSLGFDEEAEFREWVKADLESRLGEEIKRAMIAQVYQYLLDNTSFELPERLSQRQTDRVMIRRMLDLYRQGVPPTEAEKIVDASKTGAQEETARELKIFFVMEKLAEKFDVQVGEGEINGMIAAIAQRQGRRFDRVRDEISKEGGLQNLYIQIRDEKIVEQLMEKAEVTDAKPEDQKDESKAGAKKKTSRKKKPAEDEGKDAGEFADET